MEYLYTEKVTIDRMGFGYMHTFNTPYGCQDIEIITDDKWNVLDYKNTDSLQLVNELISSIK
jgi:hypothetical protein